MKSPPLGAWKEVRDAMAEGAEPPMAPLNRRRISAEAEYTRRDLLAVRLFYRQEGLFREFDSIEVSPYVAQQLSGAFAYHAPWILPESITPWNVFADVKLYDLFVPDRLLEGIETDERRVGGRITLGVEPFVHLKGHTLSALSWVDRYHVTFGQFEIPINTGDVPRSGNVPGGALNDINILGLGLDWRYSHEFREPRHRFAFLPTAEVATKALGGDIAFRRIEAELKQHYSWAMGFEVDMSWKGGMVDRQVPVFEEFALGGADSMRGFLRDDFLGRSYWSAQHDLWIPIPFQAFGRERRILAALQRSLKTALILDAGSVSLQETLDTSFARGIGVGLRWQSEGSPLVIKLDAAWGYWRGEKRFYPYLAFSRSW